MTFHGVDEEFTLVSERVPHQNCLFPLSDRGASGGNAESYRGQGGNHGKRLGQPQLSTTDDDGTVCHPFSV